MTHQGLSQAEYLNPEDARLADLVAIAGVKTEPGDYPRAAAVRDNVLIYDAARLTAELGGEGGRRAVSGELIRALRDGPGIVAFAGAFADAGVLDAASAEFFAMIADQRAAGGTAGDHFAAAGQNDRVWNALEKLAVRAPAVFVAYYGNDIVAAGRSAWLGPGYQVTSQVNVVNPGGAAQSPAPGLPPGLPSSEQARAFPAHVHRLSPGADPAGRGRAHRHAASRPGRRCTCRTRRSTCRVTSSRTGRSSRRTSPRTTSSCRWRRATRCSSTRRCCTPPGPTGPRTCGGWPTCSRCPRRSAGPWRAWTARRMCGAVYPALRAMRAAGAAPQAVANVIAASAEGYPFPTNLDRDQPIGGIAPPSQAGGAQRGGQRGLAAGAAGRRAVRLVRATADQALTRL